jgi:RNA polymerase sigma-70 factor (ECF subfamily)
MSAEADRRSRFEALFERHHDAVRSYVVRRSAGVGVEDIVADTFLIAWRRLDDVPEPALPWLLGVARRVLADQRRAVRRRRSLIRRLVQETRFSSDSWLPPPGLSDELIDALRGLSTIEREALLLIAWDGLSSHDAAVVVGCSPAAFRVRLHRARRRIAARLGVVQGTSNVTERHA